MIGRDEVSAAAGNLSNKSRFRPPPVTAGEPRGALSGAQMLTGFLQVITLEWSMEYNWLQGESLVFIPFFQGYP